MTGGPAGQLSLALDLTGELVAGVGAGQWADPTPCDEWTVADLVTHMVTGNYVFASIARGTPLAQARAAAAPVPPGEDLAERYRDAAAKLVDAYGQPGVLEQMFTIPVGTMPGLGTIHIRMVEMLVHGWDLAQATGQATAFPDDLVEQELAFTRPQLAALPPGRSPFRPGQPAADDAPAIIRLVACLGRPVPA
ncbi:MAG TPA: TIGR03086 family metal-binding protein [Streptosporangiaceae bacterium]|nr:TIGR03086 family metal-binding protein [Streptosporangiaceae bacterium]